MKRQKILIIRMDRLGDLLLSTPAVRALRKGMPDARIAVLVRSYTADIVKNNPDIDEVIVYDKDGSEKGLFGNLKFVFKLFCQRFDTAVILHTTNRALLLSFVAGIRKRVGYDRRMPFLLTDPIKCGKNRGEKHEVDYSLDVVKKMGIDTSSADRRLVMEISPEDTAAVERLLKKKGVKDGDRLICIHPGASCPSKRWKKERFRETINHLLKEGRCRIAIIGGDEEVQLAGEILEGVEMRVLNFTGLLTVGETGALIRMADMLLSNDSGPVHIASAVGTPIVAIFGRKDPGLSPAVWAPIGDNNLVLHKDAGCAVCLAHNCKIGFKCLDAISVSDVLNSIDKLLANKKIRNPNIEIRNKSETQNSKS